MSVDSVTRAPLRKMHSAPSCLRLIADFHHRALDAAKLLHEFGTEDWSADTLVLAARSSGFIARLIRQTPSRLARTPLPAIAIDDGGRCFVLAKVYEEGGVAKVLLQDPESPRESWTWRR
ncbi:cysteine peptidase family C39 domain-containing protein [Roseateles noduli]|uniref:cysteine peptidase family C39 domain-containing protein n=1 Tax=Roseateles noduli TaxID=2052484 RepID=UPI003D64DBA1